MDKTTLKTAIDELIGAAIIVKTKSSSNETTILFTHDIINKIVYKNIIRVNKHKIHFKICKVIMDSYDLNSENRDRLITSHLMRYSIEAVQLDADRWIDIVYNAGISQKQITSISIASHPPVYVLIIAMGACCVNCGGIMKVFLGVFVFSHGASPKPHSRDASLENPQYYRYPYRKIIYSVKLCYWIY